MKYKINKSVNGPLYLTEEDAMKQNANCPDSEKVGTGRGSCGGANRGSTTSKRLSRSNRSLLDKLDEAKSLIDKTNKEETIGFEKDKADLTKKSSEVDSKVSSDQDVIAWGIKNLSIDKQKEISKAAGKNVDKAVELIRKEIDSKLDTPRSKTSTYPQDLTTMTKTLQKNYLKDILKTKSFKQLRDEQDLMDAQITSAYEQLGGPKGTEGAEKDPDVRARLERGIANANFHRAMLSEAVGIMTDGGSRTGKKLYEEATGTKWESRKSTHKPGKGKFGR